MNTNTTLQVFISNSQDPYFNLALEDYLFKKVLNHSPILFFYINQPSIIIGRAQNPWLECNLELMTQDKILLARRQSGGGAVYHDAGNLNFCVLSPISPINYFDKFLNLNLIKKSLGFFNIPEDLISIGPRHDLWVNYKNINYKFSGCAFRQSKNTAFHHGTLLLNTDLSALNNYLKPSELFKDIKNINLENIKGVKSVRSPVLNLKEINPEIENRTPELIKKIAEVFAAHWDLSLDFVSPISLPSCSLGVGANLVFAQDQAEIIAQEVAHLQSFEWLYGKTLPFEITQNILDQENNLISVNLSIENGLIKNVTSLNKNNKNNKNN